MKRNAGLVAGLAVVLAYFGISNLPKGSEGGGAKEQERTSSAPVAAPRSAHKPYDACDEIARRLPRFLKEASGAQDAYTLPGSCYPTEERPSKINPRPALPHVGFAVAIVPNPVSTHLQLFFDRMIESIQQAAQDERYSYDDSWFPWDTTTKDYALLGDQQLAEELQRIQRTQPGVMVFRRGAASEADGSPYDKGLIIFVVGEKPTGGIDDSQFAHALEWVEGLGGNTAERGLRILGPTFSGSLPSLARALDRVYSKRFKDQLYLQVSSGTVSSGQSYEWFAKWIKDNWNWSYFRTATENDARITDRFCQYLKDQEYDPRRIAFLSEDETAFGEAGSDGEGASPCRDALRLYYPRDIATLRSAYEQQSILGGAQPRKDGSAPSRGLRGDLSEPSNSDHDTVRSYSGQLTPLAQEAVLLDISNRLSDQQIQFVVLRSTSSLDQIFLSKFLRRSYPEARLVIDGADLLFTRGMEGSLLRGVMLLSTYPLLTLEADWTPSLLVRRSKSYRTFGADSSEGVYVAARELLRTQLGVPLRNYTAPVWANRPNGDLAVRNRPATWLSVISHRQFWPLAALNLDTLPALKGKGAATTILSTSSDRGDGIPWDDVEGTPLRLPTTMWLFTLACAGWSAIHFYFCRHGSISGWPRARAYFAVREWRQAALIAFGSVLLGMLSVTVAAYSGLYSLLRGTNLYPWDATIGLTVLVLLILALSMAGCAPRGRQSRHGAFWTAVCCVAAYAMLQLVLGLKLTPANSVPAFWRGIHLFSGVSPLLPQLLFLAGGYLWFWCTLRGLAHLGDDRPRLPEITDLPKWPNGKPMMPMYSHQPAGKAVENASRPLMPRYLWRLPGIFLITAGICWRALDGPWVRTLGERAFGTVIFVSVTLCVAVILTDGIEMWGAWCELRQLLIYLDRLPLRRTLRALKGLAWGSIWKLSGHVLEERYRVISFQFESLRHLRNTLQEWKPDKPDDANHRVEVLSQVIHCQEKGLSFAEWYTGLPAHAKNLTSLREFQEELAATAGAVMRCVLLPAWHAEKESLIFDRSRKADESGESGGSLAGGDLAPHVRTAEEFFVLPYLGFIQNILGRLHTLALGGLWLFLGATLAVSSYPFDPLNVLGAIFLVVFLIIGGITVVAYSQMSRDATLSHITNTRPGELGGEFWLRLIAFGIGPLAGLLTTLFPSIADFAFSWLQPSVQALK